MLQPGDQIDIWVIEKALGSGGMGSVYRCHNRNASRILAAVKVLDSSLRKYPEAEARFIREAEILFQLDHPNIVKVRNVRTDADPPYLEMEFVEGESLEEALRRGPLRFEKAVEFLTQMCAAIAYLHKKGVRHRDIKPANLLITSEGRVKLVDFGLAMEADATRITQSGMAFGTVSYAPPEWIAPDTLDPAKWDLYALGVVSYEMLTGKLAFPVSGQGSARQQAMQVIVGKQGHKPLDPGDAFHDDVRALIRDLTQSDANKRISSAAEAVRRSRKLVKTLRKQSGVTLAPFADDDWHEGLDETPDTVEDRPDLDTWHGSDIGAPDRLRGPPVPTGVASADVATMPPSRQTGSTSLAPPATLGIGLVLALFAVGATVVALLALGYIFMSGPGDTRAVDVAVTGLAPGTQVGIRLGGDPVEVDGMVFSFDELSVGEHELAWTLGERCQVPECPGEACPEWCGHDTVDVAVKPGEGRQVITFTLKPPEPRRVRIRTPKLEQEWPLAFKLGSVEGRKVEGGVLFDGMVPGRYDLTARVGECANDALGCWPEGDCPPGCGSYRDKLIVPWGEGEFGWDLEMPDPAPAENGTPAPGPRPTPRPTPQPTPDPGSGGGTIATVGAFASWLGSHPEWQSDQAIAEGRAKAGYLKGWTGATPPAGAGSSHAVTDVSWYAASAFCNGRGGLAQADAEPTRWSESPSQPYIELRAKGGKAAWRSSDGRVSTKVGLADVQPLTGFRCAK